MANPEVYHTQLNQRCPFPSPISLFASDCQRPLIAPVCIGVPPLFVFGVTAPVPPFHSTNVLSLLPYFSLLTHYRFRLVQVFEANIVSRPG